MSAQKTFSAEDLAWFAVASGDYNPIHVDAAQARRLLGGAQVVHGVFTLLWALEQYAAQGGTLPQRMQVYFRRTVLVGETLNLTIAAAENDETRLSVTRQQEEVASVILSGSGENCGLEIPARHPPRHEAADHHFAALKEAQGQYELTLARTDFPRLAGWMGAAPLAALMACSRIVGMDCPGLHSLFTGLDVTFDVSYATPQLRWKIMRHTSPAAPLKIEAAGGGIHAILTAMLRPAPVQQPTMEQVRAQVAPHAYAAQKSLIIGGSRGLGELTAKIIAAGGGEVILTYAHGKKDAERVAAEIGANCSILQLDVLDEAATTQALKPYIGAITDLYYFATARIRKELGDDAYATYHAIYVAAFARIISLWAEHQLRVFYPSSIFVSECPAGFETYSAAKRAGEMLCEQLTAQLPHVTIRAPRLPRLQTDQTSGLLTQSFPPALPILLDAINQPEI